MFKTFQVKLQFFQLFYKHLINVFIKNVCVENVFKCYNVNVYLETFSNQKVFVNV